MAPRVAIIGLASDFGCQVQVTNMEDHLLDVLGLMDLSYWQLASSGHLPDEYDVAVIEGAVTTADHAEALLKARETAAVVIAIGSCAITGGIPALAGTADYDARYGVVYGDGVAVARGRQLPAPVSSVIEVDYHVPGCPIDPAEFVTVLSRAIMGLKDDMPRDPMCAICKTQENVCFLDRGRACLGLVTRTGCTAKCVTLGRPCTGCRGISPEANIPAARLVYAEKGLDPLELDRLFDLYNAAREVVV
ncbi:MAG: NADH:ubiquinone oxidoreductase [Actinobacteria bacterium]|nr:MAG: NADH:ubiquinone oxidoreductase [Actinomycetota bacterium]